MSTVLFGGGTPTLLPPAELGAILAAIRTELGLQRDAEATVEANPDSVDARALAALRAAGFTRISFGMQSAAGHVLAALERSHAPGRPPAAACEARAAGFEHVSLDGIYGTPGETDADWQRSLHAALAAGPDHLSAYALSVEPGTRLHRRVRTGRLPAPDDDVLAARYVVADGALSAAGLEWYEISNWAADPAARCRHNLGYWRSANWWGIGPGAHSHVGGVRWWNVLRPDAYGRRLAAGRSPGAARERLDADARRTERVLLALRLRDGLALDVLAAGARAAARRLAAATCCVRTPCAAGARRSRAVGACSPTPSPASFCWRTTPPARRPKPGRRRRRARAVRAALRPVRSDRVPVCAPGPRPFSVRRDFRPRGTEAGMARDTAAFVRRRSGGGLKRRTLSRGVPCGAVGTHHHHLQGRYLVGRLRLMLLACFALALAAPSAASAVHNEDRHSKMGLEFQSPNEARATSSDLAFWGDRAYVGHYGGFRIFDVSNPAAPAQIGGRECSGSQNDPVVWENRLLFLAVDRTLSGPGCDATPTAEHDDPNGWEGVRIFDVSDPANPQLLKSVYTDCGAHTITMFPKNPGQLLLYVSSYPLRPGPTCGPTRGPQAGNSPLHEKISVIRVPVNSPESARVVAEPPISYPGDPDNKFDPSEHDFAGFNPLTACHDIAVFVQLRLAAGACAEQAQLWRIKSNGLPDTANPLWVFDDSRDTDGPGGGDVAVDFWHSATFNWSGTVVNFIDESFGSGCPPVTNVSENGPTHAADTGRMFFLSTRTGEKFSDWYIPRSETAEGAYCSAHLGNVVASGQRDLLVNAWYMGGVNVVDFTDPRNPTEVAYYDMAPFGIEGSDNWSAYWYEGPSFASGGGFPVYATDGVHAAPPALTKKGFQVFRAALDVNRERLPYLNPQTQEDVIPAVTSRGKSGKTKSSSSRASKARASKARASKARKAKRAKRARYDRRAARAGVLKRLG